MFRAQHESLGREVALKILHPGRASQAEFADRFRREGRVLAGLSHPRIPLVFDTGCEAGVYFLATEYVPGSSLREIMGSAPMPLPDAVRIVVQVCEALEYAHANGLVHRDIKPENVLVGPDGAVKLADFGIAKLASDGKPVTQLTETNALIGTRAYMAPEQLERGKEVDHRADLYSLGAVFYELLTGGLPLGVFAAPSQQSGVDQRADGVVMRALEKDPKRRYQTAAEFRIASLALLEPEPRVRQLLTRRRLVSLSVGAAAFAGGAWAIGKLSSSPQPQPEPEPQPTPTGPRSLVHPAKVWSVAFAPDNTLATASEDKLVRFWNITSGEQTAAFEAFPRGELGYLTVRFSPDGQTLATAGGDNLVRIWDRETRQEKHVLRGHGREVYSVAFSPTDPIIVTGGVDHIVRLWDTRTGKLIGPLPGPADLVLSVAFSADGQRVAASVMNGKVFVWNTNDPTKRGDVGHAKRVWSIAFAPDGRLATGSHDGSVKVWSAAGKAVTELPTGSEVWSVTFAAAGRMLAAGCHDGRVRLWNADTFAPLPSIDVGTSPVPSLAASNDGGWLAAASFDRRVVLANITGIG
ncbi:MAG: serine/threonine protein kinase [Planctomycetes bacterium]|nr:serine/threonine protein kinase [Planctomycetota bacterium]